ncbi:MAG: DUF1801 domain-containing protein [Acidobacteriota bacterium]|nr:DUF1801 domain-containing protein [Acidobacteriota bacterium]
MTPEKQLASFLAKYTPAIRSVAKAALKKMRERLPGAIELVYDNYNALVITFGPTDRVSNIVFSIALYPRWVTLFFRDGAKLRDPQKLLKGSGKTIRHIVLQSADDLDASAVRALMTQALGGMTFAKRRLVIKSISKKQRPRRPATA